MSISRIWFIVLCLSQAFMLVLLVGVCWHYPVIPKLVRTLITERRIPLVSADFRMNRNYDPQRAIFRHYPDSGARGYLLGDSVVAGVCWSELMPGPGLVGRGIAGDTSDGVFHRVEDLAGRGPEWIGVLVGTDDMLRDKHPPEVVEAILRGVGHLRHHCKSL